MGGVGWSSEMLLANNIPAQTSRTVDARCTASRSACPKTLGLIARLTAGTAKNWLHLCRGTARAVSGSKPA